MGGKIHENKMYLEEFLKLFKVQINENELGV